jgi:hypothetical protein
MAENLNLNVNINTTGAEGSIGSLKKQLREAQNEVVALSDKFGATSREAVNAAKKAAELRDRIGDAKALTDAYNPDAKFKALTAALSGVAGGFGAVQGAMALFGKESEDVQKTLLKVQSAMALSQGLNAVGESIDAFKTLASQISGNVVKAFNSLRAAIGGTGIGLLVIALGTIVVYFDDIKAAISRAFPALADFGNKVKEIVQAITDWVGITSEAERKQESLKKAVEASIASIDNTIAILQAQENKEVEIYNAKKERIKFQMMLLKDATDEEIKQRAKLNTELQVLDLQEAARLKKKREDEAKAQLEREKASKDFINKIAQISIDAEKDEIVKAKESRKEKLNNDLRDMFADTEFKKQQIEGQNIIISNLKLAAQNDLDKIDEDAKKAELEKKRAFDNAVLEAEYQLQDAKFAAVSAGLDLLASLAGKNEALANAIFIVDRAMAIAKVVVDTQREIAGIAANPTLTAMPDLGASVKAPAILAAKIRAGVSIATIAATSIAKYKNGGSAAAAGIPAVGTSSPITPQLPMAQTTNLSQQTINDIGNQAVRAYVVESDITSSQERITAIRQRARFS